MRQICNLAYALLRENRTEAQLAELEMLLTEPDQKAELMERQNQESMRALQAALPPGVGLLVPPGAKPKPKEDPTGSGV
jgi:hypothetical protein